MILRVGYTSSSQNSSTTDHVRICSVENLFVYNTCDGVVTLIIDILSLMAYHHSTTIELIPVPEYNLTRAYSRYRRAISEDLIDVAGWLYTIDHERILEDDFSYPLFQYDTVFAMQRRARSDDVVMLHVFYHMLIAALGLIVKAGRRFLGKCSPEDRKSLFFHGVFIACYGILTKLAALGLKRTLIAESIFRFETPVRSVNHLLLQLNRSEKELVSYSMTSSLITNLELQWKIHNEGNFDIHPRIVKNTNEQLQLVSESPNHVLGMKDFIFRAATDHWRPKNLIFFEPHFQNKFGLLINRRLRQNKHFAFTMRQALQSGVLSRIFLGLKPPIVDNSEPELSALLFIWQYYLRASISLGLAATVIFGAEIVWGRVQGGCLNK